MVDEICKSSLALVEDNEAHALAIQSAVIDAGYDCTRFKHSHEFQKACETHQFDAVLLDWYLGGNDCGLETVKWFRENTSQSSPVVMVTSRTDEMAIVQALSAGANEFISKPVNVEELTAKLDVVINRGQHFRREVIKDYFPYRLDLISRTVSFNNTPVTLIEKEFELASYMFANSGRVLSREELLDVIWGTQESIRTVDTCVNRVRKKLSLVGSSYWKVTCVYLRGYCMQNIATNA